MLTEDEVRRLLECATRVEPREDPHRRVLVYLDCGCAIMADGRRAWCPSCSPP